MNNEILTSQNERLKKDISNTIGYWFGLSVSDSKRTGKLLEERESVEHKSLYNALSSDVNKVYSMNGIGKAIDGYSEKYDEYFASFNQKLNDFSNVTVNKIIGVIETGLQASFNMKRITNAVEKVIAEREKLLGEYLNKNIGQLENYMLLLAGADKGNSKYSYVSETSGTCNACSDLDGKIFAVNEAEVRVNFPPIHPNCKCRIELIRTYGGESGSVLLNQVNSNDLLGKLPYIDKDVERIEAGNGGGVTLETYEPYLWDNLPVVSPWLNENPSTENPSKEVPAVEDDDIEAFMNMPLEERTKLPYQGYDENDYFNELENTYSYQQNGFILRADIFNNDEQRLKEGQYADLTQISAYDGIDNSFISSESYQINSSSSAYQRTVLFAYDGDRNTDGSIIANGSCSKSDGINKWGYKVYTDTTTGLRMVEVGGNPLVCVAIPGSYGAVGDVIGIKTDMGYIDAIIGDAKGKASYYHSNGSREDIPNEDGSPVSVIEFIYDNNYWDNVILENGGRGIKGFASPNASPVYELFKCNAILEIANFGSTIPDGGKTDHYLYGDNILLN